MLANQRRPRRCPNSPLVLPVTAWITDPTPWRSLLKKFSHHLLFSCAQEKTKKDSHNWLISLQYVATQHLHCTSYKEHQFVVPRWRRGWWLWISGASDVLQNWILNFYYIILFHHSLIRFTTTTTTTLDWISLNYICLINRTTQWAYFTAAKSSKNLGRLAECRSRVGSLGFRTYRSGHDGLEFHKTSVPQEHIYFL